RRRADPNGLRALQRVSQGPSGLRDPVAQLQLLVRRRRPLPPRVRLYERRERAALSRSLPPLPEAKRPAEDPMFSDQMIVLTYVIRSDSEQRGYNPWLRTVDNPFFNSVPKIALYENWKLAGGDVTSLPWTHFDLLHPAKGVDPMDVFQVPVVAEFAANWSRLWGLDPAAEDQSVNYQIHILERVRQGKCRRGELVALVIDPDLEQLPA